MTPSRKVPIACALCCALAASMLFLPWHQLRKRVDTGLDHTGLLPVVVLGCAALLCGWAAAVRTNSARHIAGIVTSLLVPIAGIQVGYHAVIAHLLEQPEHLAPELGCAGFGVAAFVLALVLSQVPPAPPPSNLPVARVLPP